LNFIVFEKHQLSQNNIFFCYYGEFRPKPLLVIELHECNKYLGILKPRWSLIEPQGFHETSLTDR